MRLESDNSQRAQRYRLESHDVFYYRGLIRKTIYHLTCPPILGGSTVRYARCRTSSAFRLMGNAPAFGIPSRLGLFAPEHSRPILMKYPPQSARKFTAGTMQVVLTPVLREALVEIGV